MIAHWYDGAWTYAQAEAYAFQCEQAWQRDGIHKWIAYDRHDGELVGRGGLSRLPAGGSETAQIGALMEGSDWHRDRLEVGWAVLSGRQRQGYASEIGTEALAFARHELGASSVIAFTEIHNLASRGVMERIGMHQVGQIQACGLVEGKEAVSANAPFAVYASTTAAEG